MIVAQSVTLLWDCGEGTLTMLMGSAWVWNRGFRLRSLQINPEDACFTPVFSFLIPFYHLEPPAACAAPPGGLLGSKSQKYLWFVKETNLPVTDVSLEDSLHFVSAG